MCLASWVLVLFVFLTGPYGESACCAYNSNEDGGVTGEYCYVPFFCISLDTLARDSPY